MALKPRIKVWTNGKVGYGPVNGRYYFVNDESRMTFTWTFGQAAVPLGFRQVTMEEYDAFRKETSAMSPKKRKQLHAKYPTRNRYPRQE